MPRRRRAGDVAARRRAKSATDGGMGLIVAVLLVAGSLPFFLGLTVW